MPLEDFHGQTFVAFTDIAGFKALMQNRDRAMGALHEFYRHGYLVLRAQPNGAPARVDGLFISDCAVLFVRSAQPEPRAKLRAILLAVREINRAVLEQGIMLSTSIAFGHFDYTQRQEFSGIEKNLIHGAPYVEAYMDQTSGSPRLDPGQCRILHENLPFDLSGLPQRDDVFSFIRPGRKHSYFYWMCRHPQEIEDFDQDYSDAYNLKYSGMLNALKRRASR